MLTVWKAFIIKKFQRLEQLTAKHTNTIHWHDAERLGSAVFLYKMCSWLCLYTHTTFNGPFSGSTQVSRYQKGKTNLDFTGARDSEWQWHQLGHMQVCTLLQTDNHASTPPL